MKGAKDIHIFVPENLQIRNKINGEGGWSLARMAELGVKRRPKGQTTTKFFINILDRLVLFPLEKRLASFPALELLVPCSYCTSSFRIINREIQRNLILSYDALIRTRLHEKYNVELIFSRGGEGIIRSRTINHVFKTKNSRWEKYFSQTPKYYSVFFISQINVVDSNDFEDPLILSINHIYIYIRCFIWLTSNWLKRRKARWEIKRKIFKKGRYFLESIAGSVQLFIKSSPVEKALYL